MKVLKTLVLGAVAGATAVACAAGTVDLTDAVADWRPTLEVNGAVRAPDAVERTAGGYALRFGDVAWTWRVRREGARLFVASEIANRGAADVTLGDAVVFDAAAGVFGGRPDLRVLAVAGNGQASRKVRPVSSSEAARTSQVHIQFATPDGKFAGQFGFLTFRRLMTVCEWTGANGVERLRAKGRFNGWTLKAGATTPFEEFTFVVGTDPHAQLVEWAELAGRRHHARLDKRVHLGALQGGGSYNPSGKSVQESFFAQMDAINRRLPNYGFRHLWVSIVNLPGGNPGDWITWNDRNFPMGRDAFAAAVCARGWILGSWIAPFFVSSHLKGLIAELGDAVVRNPDGSFYVYRKGWAHGDAGRLPPAERPDIYVLDPSNPKTVAHIRKSMAYLREHGNRYYMVDFIKAGAGEMDVKPVPFCGADGLVAPTESFCRAMDVVREAAGEETYLLGCGGPTLHCVGAVDAVRTANDFGESRGINPESFMYPASWGINRIDFWTGPERALYNAASYYAHGRLYKNDIGNCLSVGEPVPLEEARIMAAIHCFGGSSTMLGDTIPYLSEARLGLIRRTFPREDGPAVPEDLFTGDVDTPPTVQRYDFGDATVCAVFNLKKHAIRRTLRRKGVFAVWEHFDERLLGRARDAVEVEVPPESVRIFRLAGYAKRPAVLGTSTSFLSRDARSSWDADAKRLTLAVKRPAREKGLVYVFAAPGWCVVNTKDALIAKDMNTEELVIAVPFETDDAGDWTGHLDFGTFKVKDETAKSEADRFG